MSEVLSATAAGATPPAVAGRLGVDVGLVETMLDHAERIGLVLRPGCSTCTGTPVTAACAGCPLSRA